jgi:Ca2+-binding EF-hand superfamily protein
MGAGTSVIPPMILESLPQEIDKPLDGSDVVADDGGAAAFAEVQRLRAMMAAAAEENSALAEAAFAGEAADLSTFKSDLPPDLKAHLTDLFLSQDHNNDGVLSTDQFWLLLDEAGFDLNDEEKTNVIDKCDADHDGMITWQDFTDWVTMKGCGIETDEPPAKYWVPVKNLDGTVYFFNKYSGTTAWVIPGEEDEPEEDRVSGDLTSYFTELFLTSDRDGSGNLSADEFWNLLINDASLCLQPDEVQALRVRADFDADGVRAHVADRWGGGESWADVRVENTAYPTLTHHTFDSFAAVLLCCIFSLSFFGFHRRCAGSSSSQWRRISSAVRTTCEVATGLCKSRYEKTRRVGCTTSTKLRGRHHGIRSGRVRRKARCLRSCESSKRCVTTVTSQRMSSPR